MERKSRLEWERQRMQELSTQKSRLLEQINDLKSREKALGLELQSMDDTMQTCQTKINQTNQNIQLIDQSINDMQKRMIQEKNLSENFEQQKRDLMMKLNRLQTERESIHSSFKQLNQSKEFSKKKRIFLVENMFLILRYGKSRIRTNEICSITI
jgi:chromosome segregation ATPase